MTTTNTNKILYERSRLTEKEDCLDLISVATHKLESLIREHKDTQSKELEIHQLWKRYEEI